MLMAFRQPRCAATKLAKLTGGGNLVKSERVEPSGGARPKKGQPLSAALFSSMFDSSLSDLEAD